MKMIKITKIVAVVAALCLVFSQAVPLGYADFFSDMGEQAAEEAQQPTVSAEPAAAVENAVAMEDRPCAPTTTDFLSGSSALWEEDTAVAPAEVSAQEIGAVVDDVMSRMADAGLEQDLSQTLDYISNGDYVSVVEFQKENPEILDGLISSLQMISIPDSPSVAVPDIPDINVNIESSQPPPPSVISQGGNGDIGFLSFPEVVDSTTATAPASNGNISSLPTHPMPDSPSVILPKEREYPVSPGIQPRNTETLNRPIDSLPPLSLPGPTEATAPASNGNISSLPTPSLTVSTGATVQGSNGDIGSLSFPVVNDSTAATVPTSTGNISSLSALSLPVSKGAIVQALNRDFSSLPTLSLLVSTGAIVPASNGNISSLQTLPGANSPSATFPQFVKGWLEEARGVRGALLVSQQGIGNAGPSLEAVVKLYQPIEKHISEVTQSLKDASRASGNSGGRKSSSGDLLKHFSDKTRKLILDSFNLAQTNLANGTLSNPLETNAFAAETAQVPMFGDAMETRKMTIAELYTKSEQYRVVNSVYVGKDFLYAQRMLHPPANLHPYLKWLLYTRNLTPQMMEHYLATLESVEAIYAQAKAGQGNIRYRGKVYGAFLPFAETAAGNYEFVKPASDE